MRIAAAELIDDNLEAEWDPMSFNHKDGEVIEEVPLAYIPCLWEKIESLLNQSSDDVEGKYNQHKMTFMMSYSQ